MNDAGTGRPMEARPRRRWRGRTLLIVAGAVLALGAVGYWQADKWLMEQRLVMESPDAVPHDPDLTRLAMSLGKPAYAENCAGCHGADMKGNHAKGAPNLVDAIWLYDKGSVENIERTILYGIRSGLGKARNVTDMPGMGALKILTADEVRDSEAYILSLSTGKGDPAAVERGSKLFQDKGNCYDCHGRDAEGNPDYGSPRLTDKEWLYGGDPDIVFTSIYDGRHGVCPAQINKLSFAAIRGVAVYVYEMSHPAALAPKPTTADSKSGGNQAG